MTQSITNISRLEKWLLNESTSCNISDKIEIRETSYGGRGVFSKDGIPNQIPIIKISHSYLLNFTTVIAHITSFNTEIQLPSTYKHIFIPEVEKDEITSLYSKLKLHELLELTSFQIITMYLVLEEKRGVESWWSPFIELLPTMNDFKTSPFIWKVLKEEEYLRYLPASTTNHANKMYDKFEADFDKVTELLSKFGVSIPIESFLLKWMCVNSRCLYMEIPESKSIEGNFTMAPYVDFINHSSTDQCVLKIDRTGFYVKTPVNKKYETDGELYLSYGPHSNEFLLCEYGFMLPENQWNDIDISKEVINLLTVEQIEFLKENNYFNDYTISLNDISFRTEIALAVCQESDLHFNRKLDAYLNGITDGLVYKSISKNLLKRILNNLKRECDIYIDWCDDQDIKKKTIGKIYKDRLQIINEKLE